MVWVGVVDAARLALDLLELWDLVLLDDVPDLLVAVLLLGLLEHHVLEFWQVEQDLPLVPIVGQHLVVLEILERGLVDPLRLSAITGSSPWPRARTWSTNLRNAGIVSFVMGQSWPE